MHGQQLLDAWELAKAQGKTRAQFAAELGISPRQLKRRLYVANRDSKLKNGISVSEAQNTLEIQYVGKQIKTLPELLEAGEVDLSVWKTDKHELNAWTTPAIISGQPLIFQNHQVSAKLIRIKPEPVIPTITPVEIKPLTLQKVRAKTPKMSKVLVLADLHIGFRRDFDNNTLVPFHDERALTIALQVAREIKPDTIVILGDMLDLAEWTDKFVRSPDFAQTTQPAINYLSGYLAQLRKACPMARIVALEGNHEARLGNMINVHLSFAYQLRPAGGELPALNVASLCGFGSLGVEYLSVYPDNALYLDGVKYEHGSIASSAPGGTAQKACRDAVTNTVFGHIHRREMATKTVFNGIEAQTVTALSAGCLCRVDGAVPGHRLSHNWQQGLGLVSGGAFEIMQIAHGRGVLRGKVYIR